MSRNTLRLLGLAFVLVLVVLLFANPFRGDRARVPAAGDAWLTAADVARIERIEVQGAEGERVFERRPIGWVVASQNDFPADTVAISSALRALENARQGKLISKNPDNHERFDVGEGGVEVRALAGGDEEMLALVIGGQGNDLTSSYVRRGDEPEVYSVRGINRAQFDPTRGFRDRALLTLNRDRVASVRLEGDIAWEVVRADSVWMLRSGGTEQPAQQDKVERMLNVLATLNADDFLADAARDTARTDLEAHRVTVTLDDGTTHVVQVGGKDGSRRYYAARGDRAAIYLVSEWRMRDVLLEADDLAAPPAED